MATNKQKNITEVGPMRYNQLQQENLLNTSDASQDAINIALDIQKRNSSLSPYDIGLYEDDVKTQSDVYNSSRKFGKSRYDNDVVNYNEFQNLGDARAERQSDAAKVFSGIAKGVVLTGTTFADGVIGTVAGLATGLLYLGLGEVDEDGKSKRTWSGLGNAFINNPISKQLQQINKWSEEVLPNYYTKDEIEDPWKYAFNANFWGDKFLKNLGFVAGAALSGKVGANIAGKIAKVDKIRDVFRGSVVASGIGNVGKVDDVARALLKGEKTVDGVKLAERMARQAKQLKTAETWMKLAGGVSGAIGEARIEAINASEEFSEQMLPALQQEYQKKINGGIEYDMASDIDHPEWFELKLVTTPDGKPYYNRVLSEEGKQEYLNRIRAANEEYDRARALVGERAASVANSTFLTQVPFLAFGEILQFGKFFAGGYKTGRTALNSAAIKNAVKTADGTLKLTKRDIAQGLGKTAFTAFWEGEEEVMQAGFSNAAKTNAGSYINSFYGYKIDPSASLEIEEFGKSLSREVINAHGDKDIAMERLIGSMSAILGMPSFTKVKGENGKVVNKFNGINGGVLGDISEIWQDRKAAQAAIDAYNNVINSEEFNNTIDAIKRDKITTDEMAYFLRTGKEFNYKNSELANVLNYAVLFSKVGRMQDLYDRIEEAGNVNPEDVANIREMTRNAESKSIFDSMTDEQVIEHINKQKDYFKKKVEQYQEISTNLKTLYGDNIDNDTLEEMTWATTQIKDWEERAKSLYYDIIGNIDEKIGDILDTTEETVPLQHFSYEDLLNVFYSVIDENGKAKLSPILETVNEVNRIIHNHNLSIEEQNSKIKEEINKLIEQYNESQSKGRKKRTANLLKKIKNLKDSINTNNLLDPIKKKELEDKLIDFIKIGTARANFIEKLNLLSKNPELFTTEAVQMREAAFEEYKNIVTDKASLKAMATTNIDELVTALQESGQYEDDVLEKILNEGTPEVKQLATNYKKKKQGTKVMNDILNELEVNPSNISAKNIISSAFENADSIEQALAIIEADLQTEVKDKLVKDAVRKVLDDFDSQMKSVKLAGNDSNTSNGPKSKKVTTNPESNESSKNKSGEEASLPGLSNEPVNNNDDEESNPEESKNENGEDEKGKEGSETSLPPSSKEKVVESTNETVDENTESGDNDIEESDDKTGEYTNQKKAKQATPNVHRSSSEEFIRQYYEKDSQDSAKVKTQGLRSWFESKFNIDALKKLKRAISRVLENKVVQALDETGMYDYVDSGKLGDKLQKNPKLPIYLIRYDDARLGDNKVVLAIRLEEEEKNANAIVGQDGYRYQVVGHLSYNPNNSAAKTNYYEIRKEVDKQYTEYDYNPTVFVSSLTTTVSHIYSGRMVTNDNTQENGTPRQRNINKEFLRGVSFHLGVLYNETDFVTPSIDRADSRVQSPNTNNKNPRAGTVWLMTKGADGVYYPKAVTIKRFSNTEYPLEDYYDSPFVKEIVKQLAVLLRPNESHYNKSLAKFALKDLLFFPEGNDIVFKEGTSLVSISGLANNIGNIKGEIRSDDDLLIAITNALKTFQNLNLRIQISTRKLSDASYRDMILDSEVLTTDLLYPQNVNSSFDVNPIDINSGKPIETGENANVGHTGKQGINTSLTAQTFTFNGKQYRQVEGESPVLIDGLSKEDSQIVGQMILNIMNGDKSTKVKGTTNIFEKVINNSSRVIALRQKNGGGFEIVSQEELAKIKEVVAKRIEEKKRREEAKKLEEENKQQLEESGLKGLSDTYQNNNDDEDKDYYNPSQKSSESSSIKDKKAKKEDSKKSSKPTNALDSKDNNENSYSKVFQSPDVDDVMAELKLEWWDLKDIYEQHKNKLKDPTTITSEEDALSWLETYKKCVKK